MSRKKLSFVHFNLRFESQESRQRVAAKESVREKLLCNAERNVSTIQKPERDAGDGIVPAVRDHAGAQASTSHCQQTEKRAIDSDHQHSSNALVSGVMRGAERRSADTKTPHHSRPVARANCLLKISTEDKFLAYPGGDAQCDPERRFGDAQGRKLADPFLCTFKMEETQGRVRAR